MMMEKGANIADKGAGALQKVGSLPGLQKEEEGAPA